MSFSLCLVLHAYSIIPFLEKKKPPEQRRKYDDIFVMRSMMSSLSARLFDQFFVLTVQGSVFPLAALRNLPCLVVSGCPSVFLTSRCNLSRKESSEDKRGAISMSFEKKPARLVRR